ncbi:MAG: hypothetical protein GY778_23625 [bacterium]|nr:hypothetical protein [bacterium]
MKIRQFFCMALVVGAVVLWTGCRDHFKVYQVNAVEQDQAVALRGQFDEGSFKRAKLTRLTHFANPVQKDNSRIYHPDYHLTWYELRQQEPEPRRTVAFHNQYGDQKWVIGDAKYLAVPAQKFEKGHEFPKGVESRCGAVV